MLTLDDIFEKWNKKNNILNKKNEILSEAKQKPSTPPSNSCHLSPKDLTSALNLESIHGFDDGAFQLQNIASTNFPLNTPCYIVGTKGSGKTYLLASIAQYSFKNKLFKRLFYIYAENVDTTLTRAIPRDSIYQIPRAIANQFLFKYLSKKTKFCSCFRLMKSIEGLEVPETIDELISKPIYWDNYLNDLVKRKHITTAQGLIVYAEKTIEKYGNKQLILTIDGFSVNVDKLADKQFDMFIIDDIAQFTDLLSNNRKTSTFYKYFTITRQNMTTFYLAGQELQQLPKLYRSQLGALVLLKGVDVVDSLRESKLPKLNVLEIYQKFGAMKIHEGVLINYNTGEIEFIKT